jgi:hypothetical protein
VNEEQQHILRFYDEMIDPTPIGHELVVAQRAFVSLLFQERDLSGCYFFTSHATLCISRFRTHRESSDNPLLTVIASGKRRSLHLALRMPLEAERGDSSFVNRSIIHETNCSADHALVEFDRLYGKFLSAHQARHSDGDEA